MRDNEIKIIHRKIETKFDAFAFGAAEALGKGLVYALILISALEWVKADDPLPLPPHAGETDD